MVSFFLFCHIFSSFLLILFILFNRGKGSELGAINQNNELLSNKDSSLIINRIIVIIALLTVFTNILVSYYVKSYKSEHSAEKLVNVPKNVFSFK